MIFNKKHIAAYKQAKAFQADVVKRGDAAIGDNALEFMDSVLTPEEVAESELRVSLIGELIKARREKGISQKKLEKLSGVKQPIIARMELGVTSPQLDTMLKVLTPLGKKLAVVPLEDESYESSYPQQINALIYKTVADKKPQIFDLKECVIYE